MRECDLLFFDCKYKIENEYCLNSKGNGTCTYDLIHSSHTMDEINLANHDAYSRGYVHGSPSVEDNIVFLNNRDLLHEFCDGTNSDWIKFLEYNSMKVVPFDEKRVKKDTILIIADLKHHFYSSKIIPRHGMQTQAYAMALRQRFGITNVPYFIEIIYRPHPDKEGYNRYFKPHIVMLESGDCKEEMLKKDILHSYEIQNKLLKDIAVFKEYKTKNMQELVCMRCFDKNICDSLEKCVDEENVALGYLLIERFGALEKNYRLRCSTLGDKCQLEKLFGSMDDEKLPSELRFPSANSAIIGRVLHTAFNEQKEDIFLPNRSLEKIGVPSVNRKNYCEYNVILNINDDFGLRGRCDAIYMLAKE